MDTRLPTRCWDRRPPCLQVIHLKISEEADGTLDTAEEEKPEATGCLRIFSNDERSPEPDCGTTVRLGKSSADLMPRPAS